MLLFLLACHTISKDTAVFAPDDLDQDGFSVAEGDCDDADASVYPGLFRLISPGYWYAELTGERGEPVVADLNGDAAPDLVAPTTEGLWVFMGQGDATFEAGRRLALSAVAADVGDYDGDGDPDVVGLGAGGQVQWFENTDGTLADASGVGTIDCQRPQAVKLVDLDADGTDEVIAGCGDFMVEVWGTPSYRLSVSEPATRMFEGDFDGDGDLDVMFGGSEVDAMIDVNLLVNDGGALRAEVRDVPFQPRSLAVGDIDRDGDLDMISSYLYDNDLTLQHNQGDGTFVRSLLRQDDCTYDDCLWADTLAIGDVNQDAHPDLLYFSRYGGLNLLLGPVVSWTRDYQYLRDLDQSPTWHDLVDLDGDRALEHLSVNEDGSIIARKWDGDGYALTGPYLGHDVDRHLRADLDGDGLPDVIGRASSEVSWWLQREDGLAEAGSWMTGGSGIQSWGVSDFDGDGSPDVVIYTTPELHILFLDQGRLRSVITLPLDTGLNSLTAVDIEQDGDVDLVGVSSLEAYYDTFTILANDGHGAFTTAQHPAPTSLTNLKVADVTGDGVLDLIALQGTGMRVIDGQDFTIRYRFDAELQVRNHEIGDFNGDHRNDIAVAMDDSVELFLNSGHGFSHVHIPTMETVDAMTAIDVMAQPGAEVAIRTDATVTLYHLDQTGLTPLIKLPIRAESYDTPILHAVDHDGDGDLDLSASTAYGAVSFIENVCPG